MRKPGSERVAKALLERLLATAPADSNEALFAHRHLAEMDLESNPWRAALHLRDVIRARRQDDVVHALMGLSQALLGNFRSAVACYRRALQLTPRNPWYHHNLGHLLDVALGRPAEAVAHLRMAHDAEPREHEITASFAHCLAVMGDRAGAERLAESVFHASPDNPDHRALIEWIRSGAPAGSAPPVRTGYGGATVASAPEVLDRAGSAVVRVLERSMLEAGFSTTQVARAQALWTDFRDHTCSRVQKPEVYAAAIEYAIALVQGLHGVTRASIARRYGVTPTSVAARFEKIRNALDLSPGDPRYAAT